MLSKTLDEWITETQHISSIYYEKYTASLNDMYCHSTVRNAYCAISQNNLDLYAVLRHIKEYETLYAPHKCALCMSNDEHHRLRLDTTHKKYKKIIHSLKK